MKKQPPKLETTANVEHGILFICGIHIQHICAYTIHIFSIPCRFTFGIFRLNSGVNQSLIPYICATDYYAIVIRVGEFTFICNYSDHHYGV